MNTLGTATKSKFVVNPSGDEIHVEFTVEAGQTVTQGDLVVINTNGKIQSAPLGTSEFKILGIAIMAGLAGELVTVALKHSAVINAEAAAANVVAGPVQLGAFNSTTGNREFAVAAGADDQAKDLVTVGHNLTPATADGELIQVALF